MTTGMIRRNAFSLMEMLVSIGIVGCLTALASMGIQSVSRQSRVAEDLAASRRIVQAYLTAAAENNGVLLKGRFLPEEAPDILLPDGSSVLREAGQRVVIQRYPWHLAPYLDWNVEKSFLTWANRKDFRKNQGALSSIPRLAEPQYYYAISVGPAFGQNAYGVGGYENAASSEVATRIASVPQPSRLIAFASARDNSMNGYSYVEPPNSTQNQYFMDGSTTSQPLQWSSGEYRQENASAFGHLALNHNDKAVVAFLDGHASLLTLKELRDSRLWSRIAQEKDDPDHVIQR